MIKMQFILVFLDIAKFADFRCYHSQKKERYSGSVGCDTLFSLEVRIRGKHLNLQKWGFHRKNFVTKMTLILVFSH